MGSPRLAPAALLAGLVLVVSTGCRAPAGDSPGGVEARRNNVLLIVVDTLRADHLPLYGYFRPTSPILARMAESSLVFDNAFTVMSNTLPAHVSLMTGVHPATHNVLSNGWQYDGRYPTLAERLGSAGYATAAFVSGFPLVADSGLGAGFEVYQDVTIEPGKRASKVLGELTVRRAADWLEAQAGGPFFAFVHFFDTHVQFYTPRGFMPPFSVDADLRSYMDTLGVSNLAMDEISPIPILLDGQRLQLAEAINAYDNQIYYVDGLIARLLEVLERTGADEDTMVVVTSDHGEGLGQHAHFSHGLHLYEEQLRIPLVIRPPSRARWQPARIRSAVSLLDVMPTVLELAGLDPDPWLQGESLGFAFQGRDSGTERWLLAQRRFFTKSRQEQLGERFTAPVPLHAVRGDSPWKYLRSGDGVEELYDLESDPHERHNLAEQRPEDARQLAATLDQLLAERTAGTPPEAPVIDDETREKLRALGYIE